MNAEFDPCANLLLLAGARETKGIAVHELTHFVEHCSTPYGLFQDQTHEQTLKLTLEFLREHDGPVYTPIHQWVRQFLADPTRCPGVEDAARFEKLVDAIIKPWSKHMHLWQVLEGRDYTNVRRASVSELVRLLPELEGETPGATPVAEFQDEACPLIQCEGTKGEFMPVGAWHISECIAQILEGFAGITAENTPPEYFVLLLLGVGFLKATEAHFGRNDRRLELTLLALADLSLFTPIGPTYGELRASDYDWAAVHPGWRFCRALELVAKEDWWVISLFEGEILQDRVCERLGWPSPRRFLEIGSRLPAPTAARHRDACQIRLDDRMAFYRVDRMVESESTVAEFIAEHLPMVHYPGIGTIFNVPPQDKENDVALQQLKNCYFARRYADAMQESTGPRVLPQDCQFELYFTNIRDEEDFAQLIAQNSPWLDGSRLIPL
jgi:hypothetical protein